MRSRGSARQPGVLAEGGQAQFALIVLGDPQEAVHVVVVEEGGPAEGFGEEGFVAVEEIGETARAPAAKGEGLTHGFEQHKIE